MIELLLLFTGAITGFLAFYFLTLYVDREFGCQHEFTSRYNEEKHCLNCGKKLKTK